MRSQLLRKAAKAAGFKDPEGRVAVAQKEAKAKLAELQKLEGQSHKDSDVASNAPTRKNSGVQPKKGKKGKKRA